MSRPLGDAGQVERYLAEGRAGEGRLARRLESDGKALLALYRYGLLHGGIRLRWGYLDEGYGVDWTLPGEQGLVEALRGAQAAGATVDLVAGRAPGWSNPWERAVSGQVAGIGREAVTRRTGAGDVAVPTWDVQALPVDGEPLPF